MKRFTLALPFTFTLLLLSALWLASTASPAHAAPTATIIVNTLDDENNSDSDCSLREAIAAANTNAVVDSCTQGSGDDTIIFDALLNGTIVLSSTLGDLDISSNLTINGGNVITVSGNNAIRVFNVTAGNVTFDSLGIISGTIITNDCADFSSFLQCGGGIMIQNSTVMVSNSTLSGNSAGDDGGGIYNYGGTVTVSNSTLSGNSAGNGGGIYNYVGTVTVSNSTLSGNSADGDGGGIYNASSDGTCGAVSAGMTIHNSTLSGNSAYTNGGGIDNFNGVMVVTHTTITGNTVGNRGGGVFSRNNSDTCTRVGHTIIAGNSNSGRGDVATDIGSLPTQRYVSLGHNLIGTAGTNVDFTQEFNQTGDITNTLPLLGALADNGGQTQTVAPMPNSVAIDNGDCTSGPATDQRGVARPQDDTCDIGAYEGGTMQCGVSAGNSYTFANQSGVSILVNSEADLECLYVDEIPVSHPNATGVSEGQDLRTGKYWLIGGLQADRTSTATFNVDLTLPYLTASTTTRACKWLDGTGPGFGWNCEDGVMGTSFDLNSSVTREDVTVFSQWAVGNGVGPTAVTNLQTDVTPAAGQGWLVALLVGLLGVLTTAVVKRRRHS